MKICSVTRDLFEDTPPQTALSEFTSDFNLWVAEGQDVGRFRRASAVRFYRDMWEVFVSWCLAQQPVVRLSTLTVADIRLFFSTRSNKVDGATEALGPRYIWRLARLIDRVQLASAQRNLATPNTAAADFIQNTLVVRYANANGSDLPNFLPAADARSLVSFLSHIRPRARGPNSTYAWQELRNRASVAVQLGAGLTPGEIRSLKLTDVKIAGGRLAAVPWKLHVAATGNTASHETPIALWAGQLLKLWLEARTALGIDGDWLFPSTKSGKQWGKASQHACVQQVLDDADVEDHGGGSFRLRHTFAVRQLRRGKSPADVARWLGLTDIRHMARYTRVLATPVELA